MLWSLLVLILHIRESLLAKVWGLGPSWKLPFKCCVISLIILILVTVVAWLDVVEDAKRLCEVQLFTCRLGDQHILVTVALALLFHACEIEQILLG